MSIEAMKLALEALETYHGYMEPLTTVFGGPRVPAEQSTTGKVERAITSLRQDLEKALKQEQGEPVAWRPIETAPKDGSMLLVCLPRQMNIVVRAWYNRLHNFWQTDYEGEGGITRPTYFHEGDLWHPIPPLYTTPQQRTWVGLTDEEIDELHGSPMELEHSGALEWVRIIEAKLKEKNG